MGDKLFIFDIDSALDKLEDDLINNEVKSKVNSESQQQNENEGREISIKVDDQSISASELTENNGNESSTSDSLSEVILPTFDNSTQTQSKVVLSSLNNTVNDDDSQIHTEARSDLVQSVSVDKVTSSAREMNSSSNSDSSSSGESSSGESESSDEDIKDEEIKRPDQIPMISDESTSKYRDINLGSNDDSSQKQLLNSDESNLIEVEGEEEEEEEDLNVTTDLTLTKTVEPTEYDPEPESNQLIEKPIVPEPVVEVEREEERLQEDPIKVVYEKIVEERFDIKELSHNFESTMDDISDAELESLEQELDDLIAAAAENSERLSEENEIKSLEESVEKTVSKANVSEKKIEEVKNDEPLECLEEVKEVPMEISSENQKMPDEEAEVAEEPTSSIVEVEQPESVSEAQEAIEPVQETPEIQEASNNDAEAAVSISSTDESASIQNLPSQSIEDFSVNESVSTGSLTSQPLLGHVPPHWVPDSSSQQCMQCDQKFTLIKRRHHCRACGLLLCANCCNFKHYLHYSQSDGRVCERCCEILKSQLLNNQQEATQPTPTNPSTYCSTIPVQQQVNSNQEPPTVMVPTGVLKRTPRNSTERKSVMFSDGIRPGTDLDDTLSPTPSLASAPAMTSTRLSAPENPKLNFPKINEKNNSYVPEATNELPPIFVKDCEFRYVDNNVSLLQRLRQEELKFAINKNFYVIVKIVTLTCCTNKTVINFSTFGLATVRQDEIMILLELNDDMTSLPNEVFSHLNEIYCKADKSAVVIKEYGHSQASSNNFLGAFGGFLYIRPTFQCLQSLTLPESPYLIGLLVHKWEVPWMRLFPLRLILRLGALYRYYPTPILSNINREPVFAEIGNTIMNFLVDFRNFSYTIEIIKGLNILMEVKKTSVFIPRNRYDQIMKVINNSTDHLLAFGADFSKVADGHLVCIQNIDSSSSESLSYSTQMINIQGQERIRTGASFLILNGALKQSSGLKAKCSIVEDGLMIQIFASKMQSVRDALKNMKNVEIPCGPMDENQKETEEILSIEWIDDDLNFNKDVVSPIDNLSFEGKESIRTRLDITSHSHTKVLRWCEVFQLESDEAPVMDDHLNYSKICEPIAKACGNALLPFMDLMAVNQLRKIGIRVTLGENIKYLAGSNGLLFSPIYMNALDNELIAVIHRQASNMSRDSNITLELIFYILNK